MRRRGGCSARARRSSTSAASRRGRAPRPCTADEELRRVEPVLEALAGEPVSIDTSKAEVARRALELGAEMVNDVTALRGDPELVGRGRRERARTSASCTCSASRGRCRSTRATTTSRGEVAAFLEERLAFAVSRGRPRGADLPRSRASASARRSSTTSSCCAGSTSCSRSAGRCSSASRARARSAGSSATRRRRRARRPRSVGAAVAAYERGATILRVHDVREHVEALTVARAVAGA